MKKSSTKKEMILSTAIQLFTKESYITVGVDRIIDESQVAKATFYKHFSSKENLVIACLQRLKDEIRVSVEDRIFNLSTPLEKLYQLYMWYMDWIDQNGGKGCPFHKARMDVAELYPPILITLDEYRSWLFQQVSLLFEQLEVNDPRMLTNLFIHILDGVISDSAIDESLLQPQKTWVYIRTLIGLEMENFK